MLLESPVHRLHHVPKDAAVLHQLVCALLRRGEVVLSHLVHQVVGNAAAPERKLVKLRLLSQLLVT